MERLDGKVSEFYDVLAKPVSEQFHASANRLLVHRILADKCMAKLGMAAALPSLKALGGSMGGTQLQALEERFREFTEEINKGKFLTVKFWLTFLQLA